MCLYYQKRNLKLCWLSILPEIKRPLTKKKIKLLFNSFQLHWNVLRAYLLVDQPFEGTTDFDTNHPTLIEKMVDIESREQFSYSNSQSAGVEKIIMLLLNFSQRFNEIFKK